MGGSNGIRFPGSGSGIRFPGSGFRDLKCLTTKAEPARQWGQGGCFQIFFPAVTHTPQIQPPPHQWQANEMVSTASLNTRVLPNPRRLHLQAVSPCPRSTHQVSR